MTRIALLFPGQGSQYVGMGRRACEVSRAARDVYAEASEAIGVDLLARCAEGPIEALSRTEIAQPAILAASVAAFRVAIEVHDIDPAFLAGHSLGEYSALTCASALTLADAVRLVHLRGRLMQAAMPEGGAMLAILGVGAAMVEEACRATAPDRSVVVASYNAPEETVISGRADVVAAAGARLERAGATVKRLRVSAAFHAPFMAEAAQGMRGPLEATAFHDPRWPVISNVDARPHAGRGALIEQLVAQITRPVRWAETMALLRDEGVTRVISFGPGDVLVRLARTAHPSMAALALETGAEPLAGAGAPRRPAPDRARDQDRDRGVVFVGRCLGIAAATRCRSADAERYREGVVAPYRALEQLQRDLEAGTRAGGPAALEDAAALLERILRAKEVPAEERARRIGQIARACGVEGDLAGAARSSACSALRAAPTGAPR